MVLVTSMLDAVFLNLAREAGADALWYKERGDEELEHVLLEVLAGGTVYPDLAPVLTLGCASSTELTESELAVLRCLVAGMTDKEIAETLHFSVWTVRSYIQYLLQKTGYKNRVELAVSAHSSGLIAGS